MTILQTNELIETLIELNKTIQKTMPVRWTTAIYDPMHEHVSFDKALADGYEPVGTLRHGWVLLRKPIYDPS